MNRKQKTNLLLAGAAIAPGMALLITWASVQSIGSEEWLFAFSLLSIVLVAVGVGASIVLSRTTQGHQVAQRYFEMLARMEDEPLRIAHEQGTLDGIDPLNPWHETFRQLRDRVLEQNKRHREAEMVRTSLELKARRLQNRLDQLQQVIGGLAEPLLACDEYGEVVVANPPAEQLLGFDLQRSESRILRDLIGCQELLDLVDESRRRRVASQRVRELEFPGAEGRPQWYRVTANNLVTPGAETSAGAAQRPVVASFRNIGLEKEIQKRNAEFVSAVSHEMKTPLAGIMAYVELLADGDAEDEETRAEFLQVIGSQTERLRRLVDNLLNIARIEAGVVTVSKESQSLNEILEESRHVVQPAAEAKRIDLQVELSSMYLSVHVDHDLLLQAVINLLSNAVKYTPDGKSIVLRSRLEGNEVTVEVEDTGVGLSEEDQERVFEKFYRVSKDKQMAGGTGLGLPLAKHIVEDVHGGRLSLRSQPGVGSTFRIHLPIAARVGGMPALQS